MMFKRLFLIVLVITTLGCSQKENFMYLEKEDFIVSYPVSLSLTEEGDEGTVFVLRTSKEDENDSFVENINLVTVNIGNLNFDSLTSKAIIDIDKIADIIENRRIKMKGSECLRVIFQLSEQGKRIKVIQHFYVKEEKAYVLTFTSEERNFNKFFDKANSVLMSFRLK
ncbi:hypothetical protein TPENAI_20401 [Tenacibaculum litopenaei]|uniref:hypothetical protein n=1 Tax=Tenacibaculum litopenaei TaxID=396016 RepID=UPI0038957579